MFNYRIIYLFVVYH